MREIKIIASMKVFLKRVTEGVTQFIDKHLKQRNSLTIQQKEEQLKERLLEEYIEECVEACTDERLEHELEQEFVQVRPVQDRMSHQSHMLTMTLDKLLALDFDNNKGPINPLHRERLLIKAYRDSQEKVIYLYPRAPTIRVLNKEKIYILHRYG